MKRQKMLSFRRLISMFISVCMLSSLLITVNVAHADTVEISSTNLLANSSFQNGLEGWTTEEEYVSLNTDEGVDDLSSVHFSSITNPWKTVLASNAITVEANTDYVLSFYSKGNASIGLRIGTSAKEDEFAKEEVNQSNFWEKYTWYFNSGDATEVKVAFSLSHADLVNVDLDRLCLAKDGEEETAEINVDRSLSSYNMVSNGDFENYNENGKSEGWGKNSKGTFDGRGLGVDGSNALVFNNGAGYDIQQNPGMDHNATYRVSFLAKYEDGVEIDGNFNGSMFFGPFVGFSKHRLSSTKWTRITRYVKASSNTIYIRTESSCKVLIDNITVNEVTDNLLVNGNFEDGFNGWTYGSTEDVVSVNATDAYAGNSLHVSETEWAQGANQDIAGLPKGRYRIRFQYKGKATIFLSVNDKQVNDAPWNVQLESSEWKTGDYTFDIMDETATVKLRLFAGDGGASFDNVEFYRQNVTALELDIKYAKKELDSKKATFVENDYNVTNWALLQQIYDDAISAFGEAETTEDVTSIKEQALADMDAVPLKTLDERKTDALAQWALIMATCREELYTPANWQVILAYDVECQNAINNAETEEELPGIIETWRKTIAAVEKSLTFYDGALVRRVWTNVGNGNIAALESFMQDERYTENNYDKVDVLEVNTKYETNVGDNLVVSHIGYVRAPQTGKYTFRIQGSDDAVRLDVNNEKVAYYDGYNGSINQTDVNHSAVCEIDLVAGERVPIDIMYKEAGGGDIAWIQWKGPGIGDGNTFTDIDRKYLSCTEEYLKIDDLPIILTNPIDYKQINLTYENGTVEGLDAVGYYVDSTATLTAVPNEGYLFEGWLVDGEKVEGVTLQLTMNKDYEVEALFVDEPIPTPTPEPPVVETEEPIDWPLNGFNADGSYEEATLVDGVYEIANAGQLYWFANLVNTSDDKNMNGKLVADIDMGGYVPDGVYWKPIACTATYSGTANISDFGYAGTFDGGYYTIRNLTVPSPGGGKSAGLFGTVSGTVKNLEIDGFVLNTGDDLRGGAIAGQVVTGGLVTDCLVKNSSVTIPVAGAAVGANYDGTVNNVLVLDSAVSGVRTGMIIGDNRNDPGSLTGTINNCYTDGSALTSGQNGNVNGSEANISDERLASGEIAYKLNVDRDPAVWGQNIDADEGEVEKNPVIGGLAVLDHGDGFYSNKEYDPEAALKSAKAIAIGEIENYLDKTLYREAQQAEIDQVIARMTLSINAAENIDSVHELNAAAKAELDEIKTNIEMREDDWNQDKENGLVKNLVLNGNFDDKELTYWDTSALTAGYEVLDEQFESKNVLKLNQGSGYIVQLVSVVPGKFYKFSYGVHTLAGLPVMSVHAYDKASGKIGDWLCENGWNQPAEVLETRIYQFYDSSAHRKEYFSAEGDVVAVVLRASSEADVYLDNIKLEGLEPGVNEQFLNMNNNMVADAEYFSTDGTKYEIIQKDGRETVHMYTTLNEETGVQDGYGFVYRWTKVIPGRKYVVSGWKQTGDNGQLERINLYTVDEEGKLLSRIADQNWGHADSRHYVLGAGGHTSNRDKAFVPGDDVYGIAVAVENTNRLNGGVDVSQAWYGDLAIYDVTESYAFDAEDVPTVVDDEIVISSKLSGNTIDINVSTDSYTVDIDSYDGSKVEYFADQYCGIPTDATVTGLESGMTKTMYAKVYSRYNAQARVYAVNVTMINTDPTPIVEYVEVKYLDINNNVVKTSKAVKGEAIGTLIDSKMYRDGYEFEGWYLNGEKVTADYVVEDAISLKPMFTKEQIDSSNFVIEKGDKVLFDKVNGYAYQEGMENALALADKIVLKADVAEGQEVDYWTINGKVVSCEQTLSLMVQRGTMSVDVVLKDVGTENTKTIDPSVIITSTISRPEHGNRFYVYSMRLIDDTSKVAECGVIILRGTNATETPEITLETAGIHKIKSSRQGNMGEYAVVRKDNETQYCVRSYMKLTDGTVVYSDAVTVTLDVQ